MTAALPPLDDALITRRLLTEAGGAYARIQRLESVGSTNEWLRQALAAEAQSSMPRTTAWPHLSALTAEEQTGGRGRLGRVWSSPKGASLSTSIVVRPALDPAHLGWISMLAGRALVDTLRQDFGLDAEGRRAVLKWPNDVQVTQAAGPARKISGILATTVPGAVVVGVGINVLLTPEQLPIENSTSVLIELHRRRSDLPVDPAAVPRSDVDASCDVQPTSEAAGRLRTELLCCFLERFAELLGGVEEAAREAPETVPQVLRTTVASGLTTLGQEVRVELPDGTAERGLACGLTSQGALQVEVTARRPAHERGWTTVAPIRRSFSAGDVIHLRGSDHPEYR